MFLHLSLSGYYWFSGFYGVFSEGVRDGDFIAQNRYILHIKIIDNTLFTRYKPLDLPLR